MASNFKVKGFNFYYDVSCDKNSVSIFLPLMQSEGQVNVRKSSGDQALFLIGQEVKINGKDDIVKTGLDPEEELLLKYREGSWWIEERAQEIMI